MKIMLGFAAAALAFSAALSAPASAGEGAKGAVLVAYSNDHGLASNYEGFVAALLGSRLEASKARSAAQARMEYRNIYDQAGFLASLVDRYEPDRYEAMMDRSRFTALDGCGHRDADLLSGPESAARLSRCD